MPNSNLVEIAPPAFDVALEIAYATADNFTGRPVYAKAGCFLHMDAAQTLQRAIAYARSLGFRLKVFDAYRPTEAQYVLWEHTPDPEFLADPTKGSPHSRGIAVDLTLIDASGHALDMGTAFDAFTPRSHHGVQHLPQHALHNRCLLLGIMTFAGFQYNPQEWWHYQLPASRRYPLLSDTEAGTGLMSGQHALYSLAKPQPLPG